MRTTLVLDDNLVTQAKQLAKQQGSTLGRVISDLALQTLMERQSPKMRNGVRLLTPRPGAKRADLEFVNKLRDEE